MNGGEREERARALPAFGLKCAKAEVRSACACLGGVGART